MDDLDPNGDDLSMKKDRDRLPRQIAAARTLFFLLAGIWILFGATSLINGSDTLTLILVILMIINAAVLAVIGRGIGKQQRLYYNLGLILLAGNILLTIADEFGWLDLLVLVIYIVLAILMLASRSVFILAEK